MTRAATELRDSAVGEILVAQDTPPGSFLFWTTRELHGALEEDVRRALLDVPEPRSARSLATCTQVHGTRSVRVEHREQRWCEQSECDGLWTEERGLAIAIKVADCLPVTLIDRGRGLVANLHAGWRGAAAGIVSSTIEELPVAGADLSAWLGPSIRACCFEVGHEVIATFEQSHGDVSDMVTPPRREGANPHLDLSGLVVRELERAGLAADEIRDTGYCTRCEGSKFHSYRRSGAESGRNLAVAGLLDG